MYHQVAYVFTPKPNLKYLLTMFPTLNARWGKPEVWIIDEGGYGEPTASEKMLTFKLLFLAQFRSTIIERKYEGYMEILEKTLGEPPYNEIKFDEWWTIESSGQPKDLETVIYHISVNELGNLEETGIPRVDRRIDRIKEYKNENNTPK